MIGNLRLRRLFNLNDKQKRLLPGDKNAPEFDLSELPDFINQTDRQNNGGEELPITAPDVDIVRQISPKPLLEVPSQLTELSGGGGVLPNVQETPQRMPKFWSPMRQQAELDFETAPNPVLPQSDESINYGQGRIIETEAQNSSGNVSSSKWPIEAMRGALSDPSTLWDRPSGLKTGEQLKESSPTNEVPTTGEVPNDVTITNEVTPRMREATIVEGASQNKFVNPKYLPQPKTAAEYAERIRQTEEYEPRRQPKWWNRLGKGFLDGLVQWSQNGQQGGIYGLMGSLAGGGAGYAFSPGMEADARKQKQLQKLWTGYQRQSAIETDNLQKEALRGKIDKPEVDFQNKLKIEQQKFENRMSMLNRQADIRSGEVKLFTDQNGLVWKQFLKPDASGNTRPMEPVVNPTTGEQEFNPGEQLTEWTNPRTGQKERVKAKETLGPEAMIANADAQRQQDAEKFNSSQEFQAQKTNADNLMTYNKQVFDQTTALAKADAANTENLGEMNGAYNELATLQTAYNNAYEAQDIALMNSLVPKMADAQAKYDAAVGKLKSGQQIVGDLSRNGIVRPQTIKPIAVKAAQVGGGGQKPPRDVAIQRIKQTYPQATPAQIEEMLQKAGY